MKLLGYTKVSVNNSITLTTEAKEMLNISRGDTIAFYEDNGSVMLKKVNLVPVG